jgi:hypothetical protein
VHRVTACAFGQLLAVSELIASQILKYMRSSKVTWAWFWTCSACKSQHTLCDTYDQCQLNAVLIDHALKGRAASGAFLLVVRRVGGLGSVGCALDMNMRDWSGI